MTETETSSPCARFKAELTSSRLSFLMEAHNAISARIVERAGFDGIWASSLTISASLGLRDRSEASSTQMLEVWESMADATSTPILVDGETGYGDFNNARRLVRKLCQRGIAAICLEEKVFPKENSLLTTSQALIDPKVFAAKIQACKDWQTINEFSVIARVEALVAGRGLDEAIQRAETYHAAGADGILIHSRQPDANEVLAFTRRWGGRCPLLVVPTTYSSTPADVLRSAGISMAIWANHSLRAAVAAIDRISRTIALGKSCAAVSHDLAALDDLLTLVDQDELTKAERRYLPRERSPVIDGRKGAVTGPARPVRTVESRYPSRRLSILVLGQIDERVRTRLAADHCVEIWDNERDSPPSEVLSTIDVIIVRSPHRVTAERIRTATRLRLIVRAGSGTDNIDEEAARRRGIVVRTTARSATSVAELTVGLLLAVTRQISVLHSAMQRGEWQKTQAMGTELAEKSVAILGYGRVGRAVARLLAGFEMKVIIVDRSPWKPEKSAGVEELKDAVFLPLDDALASASVVVVCLPHTPETHHLLSEDRLRLLPRGAVVINVGRGAVVHFGHLEQGLRSGHLGGVGLDTFPEEPPGRMSLFDLPNVVATPHVGGQTREALERNGIEIERAILEEMNERCQNDALD